MAEGYIDRDGGYTTAFRDNFNPFYEGHLLNQTFPDLCDTAAEDMLGELPVGERSRNVGQGAGPALGQLFTED